MTKEKIKFTDLSAWLKFGIIGSWIITSMMIIFFIIGFIEGIYLGI